MKHQRPQLPLGAPSDTVWFGGPIGWFKVSLQVQADDLVPVDISNIFGVSPDYSEQKGIPLKRADGSFKRVSKVGRWVLETREKDTDEWDVEEVAWNLLRRLPSSLDIWRSILENATIRLSIALSLESANQGFSLEPEFIRYTAERGIGLDFDIYREDDA